MKKNIFRILSLLLAVSFLSSCLKDDSLVLNPAKGNNVIEFANPAQISSPSGSVFPLYTFSYSAVAQVSLPVTISYSGPESGAPQDITVNIAPGTATQVSSYNTNQSTNFQLMPSTNYTLSASQVVIKQGESKATFNVVFKPNTFDFSKSLVLPLTISSVSSGIISGNFGTILLSVNVKNQFDGAYSFKGYILRNSASGPDLTLSGNFKGLTNRLNTLGLYQNSFSQYWANGTNVGGIDGLNLTVDPTTNKVTIRATGNATLKNTAGYDSRYDPATKTFYLGFDWGTAPSNRAAIDTLTYTGP